ncbi:MAG: EFR1 family ferrodoxin [Negativicutes bacterium]|nr:EFR1 family ferrodoxin [Negativicutes bacterium]
MSTVIYYFTGTGNSLKIAKDLQNELTDAKLIRICKTNLDVHNVGESDQVGFVFPVYFRGLPHMVKKFVENLSIDRDKYIFAVANYGSYAALSFIQLNNILSGNGAKLSAVFGVAMPGNMWFMYYPHPKQDFINRICTQKDATLKIAHQIKNRSRISIEDVIANRSEEEERYHLFTPNHMDKDFWTDQKCNGCGTCSKLCPANNIKIIDNKPEWQQQCEFCLACIHWCPNEAIEYKQDSINKDRYHHPTIKVQELFRTDLLNS